MRSSHRPDHKRKVAGYSTGRPIGRPRKYEPGSAEAILSKRYGSRGPPPTRARQESTAGPSGRGIEAEQDSVGGAGGTEENAGADSTPVGPVNGAGGSGSISGDEHGRTAGVWGRNQEDDKQESPGTARRASRQPSHSASLSHSHSSTDDLDLLDGPATSPVSHFPLDRQSPFHLPSLSPRGMSPTSPTNSPPPQPQNGSPSSAPAASNVAPAPSDLTGLLGSLSGEDWLCLASL